MRTWIFLYVYIHVNYVCSIDHYTFGGSHASYMTHIHFSDRNVMLRSVSDRIDGGSPGVCVWEIGQVLPGLCMCPAPIIRLLTILPTIHALVPTSSRRSFILRLSTLLTPAIFLIQLFSHTCSLC